MLLDDFCSKLHKLSSRLSRQLKHPIDLKVLDVGEFVFSAFNYALFHEGLETTELFKMELIVAIIERVFKLNAR